MQSVLEGVRGLVELDLVNQSSLGDPLNLESDNLSGTHAFVYFFLVSSS